MSNLHLHLFSPPLPALRTGRALTARHILAAIFFLHLHLFSPPLPAAVSLSLASTNDYRLTSPGTTNLVGIGMGPGGEYLVPRAEDVSFLREALTERAHLLYAGCEDMEIVTNGLAVAEGRLARTDLGADYARTLFSPSFGDWQIGRYGWHEHGVFVSSSFNPSSGRHETDSSYAVNGIDTATNNLAAFVSASDAVSASLLATNVSLKGALRRSSVMCAYSNVTAGTRILYRPLLGDTVWAQTKGATAWTNASDSINYYTQSAPYTYHDKNGEAHSATYDNGYVLRTRDEGRYATTNDAAVRGPNMVLRVKTSRGTDVPYGYIYNDYESPTKYRSVALAPYNNEVIWSIDNTATSGKPTVEGDFFTIATNYASRADVFIVLRFAVKHVETYSGATSLTGTTTRVNHYVLTNTATASVVTGTARWEVDFDIAARIHAYFEDSWVYDFTPPEVDVLNPENMDTIPQMLGAYREREIRIDGIDVGLYFNFIPTFRARIIDN